MNAAEGVAVAGVGEGKGQPAVAWLHGLKTHSEEGEVGRLGEQVHEAWVCWGLTVRAMGRPPFSRVPASPGDARGMLSHSV